METFFIHLLKSSFILLLFLFTYYVFLKKETFFSGNRLFLLSGLLIAFILPFIHITKTIFVEPSPLAQNDLFLVNEIATNTTNSSSFNWISLLIAIYLIGVVYFSIKLITQLTVIKKIKKNSDIIEEDSFYHVKTKKQISPFSFFKHIFYNPKQFKGTELNTILEHEKVHARELHSIDIIFTELLYIVLWFNPIIWFYRIIIKQNLEFLADAKTCKINQDKKFYQYLMLKQAVGSHTISIANPFFNSIIKKRIVMLNQNQSKRVNLLKLLLVIPLLALFLVGFNTKEIVRFSEKSNTTVSQQDIKVELVINMNTTDKDLNKNTEFFKKQGVSIQFKGIKRNSKDEITAIKINYDNNAGSKGNYQQKKDSPIDPIKIIFTKKDESNPEIIVGKAIETNTVAAAVNNNAKGLKVRKEGENKIILSEGLKITKEGDNLIILSDDKEITPENLANQGELEKMIIKKILTIDTISVDIEKSDVNEVIIEPKTLKDSIFIEKTDSLTYNITEIVIDKKGDGNLFILDTNNAGDYPNHFKVVTSDLSKPLFILNGKEITSIEFENLDHDKFDTISILKDDEAEKKYSKKAKNGVVQITMKKEK